jgi:hypothetical protein
MNTANLQLEGLLLALSSLVDVLKRKGLLTQQEIEEALDRAEANALADARRPPDFRGANVDAACFPIRFLRLAAARGADQPPTFTEIATSVGRTKSNHLGGPPRA